MPFTFEEIEAARSQIKEEYSFIDRLSQGYRIHVNDLVDYVSALDRIRKLNTIIRSS